MTQRQTKWTERHAPMLFSAVGFVFFFIGIGLATSGALYDRFGVKASGTVTDTGQTGGNSSTNWLAFRFTAPDGEEYTGRSSGYSGRSGESVLIEYLSIHPGWNRVSGAGRRSQRWQWWIAGFGGAFALIGLHWGVSMRRRRQLRTQLKQSALQATGQVVRVSSNGVVQYLFAAGGQNIKGRTLGTNRELARTLKAGDELAVLYDSADPARNIWSQE